MNFIKLTDITKKKKKIRESFRSENLFIRKILDQINKLRLRKKKERRGWKSDK